MEAAGVLEGSKMAMAFNMLRSNDLIWSYVVSNYLKGQPPSAFDLLHWNSDATRMPAANHSYYLRNCYLENRLSTGSMVLDNTLLDLSKVKVPVYNLATREDHIAPAEFGAVRLAVLRRPGEIRAVRLRPYRRRGQSAGRRASTSTGPTTTSRTSRSPTGSRARSEHKGSWWPDWRAMAGEHRRRAKFRRARSAPRRCRRSRTRPAATSGSARSATRCASL